MHNILCMCLAVICLFPIRPELNKKLKNCPTFGYREGLGLDMVKVDWKDCRGPREQLKAQLKKSQHKEVQNRDVWIQQIQTKVPVL